MDQNTNGKTLKRMISSYMYLITVVLLLVILIMLLYRQITMEKKRAREDAIKTIRQIEVVLEENQSEIAKIEDEYRETCIYNAETVAYMIEENPAVLNSEDELKHIAELVEIDEIHIFDTSGKIFAGTHPKYLGYTMESGEQMMFFKPMLEDKSLKLVQDITPNTAEGKPMQYSAVWSEDGSFIVQIGMEPINLLKLTEKNELSHIFSLFRVNWDADYYAIDAESKAIVGATDLEIVGKNVGKLGISFKKIEKGRDGFYGRVNGTMSFCVFEKIGQNYIGKVVPTESLYQRVPVTVFSFFICLLLVAFTLAKAVVRYMNRYVVMQIEEVNGKLKSIADGNLDEVFDMSSSVEFMKLSSYINLMVKSLVDNNKKISYVLNKTNMPIGTYEYGSATPKVRYTEEIPTIFSIDMAEIRTLTDNFIEFEAFLKEIKECPVRGEEGIYKHGEKYIRLEEIHEENEVFGVAVDVTVELAKRKKIEEERDIDALTGLYNRRGLDDKLAQLFLDREKLRNSVIFMIDADGLKSINDTYGHEKGDIYLKKLGQLLEKTGTKKSIAARQGGDEFVLFLYDYENIKELEKVIKELEYKQTNCVVTLEEGLMVPLRFSIGYSWVDNKSEYSLLMKKADERMYCNKLNRKKNMQG